MHDLLIVDDELWKSIDKFLSRTEMITNMNIEISSVIY